MLVKDSYEQTKMELMQDVHKLDAKASDLQHKLELLGGLMTTTAALDLKVNENVSKMVSLEKRITEIECRSVMTTMDQNGTSKKGNDKEFSAACQSQMITLIYILVPWFSL